MMMMMMMMMILKVDFYFLVIGVWWYRQVKGVSVFMSLKLSTSQGVRFVSNPRFSVSR